MQGLHYPPLLVVAFAAKRMPFNPLLGFALFLAAALALAWGAAEIYDTPVRSWLKRIGVSKRGELWAESPRITS